MLTYEIVKKRTHETDVAFWFVHGILITIYAGPFLLIAFRAANNAPALFATGGFTLIGLIVEYTAIRAYLGAWKEPYRVSMDATNVRITTEEGKNISFAWNDAVEARSSQTKVLAVGTRSNTNALSEMTWNLRAAGNELEYIHVRLKNGKQYIIPVPREKIAEANKCLPQLDSSHGLNEIVARQQPSFLPILLRFMLAAFAVLIALAWFSPKQPLGHIIAGSIMYIIMSGSLAMALYLLWIGWNAIKRHEASLGGRRSSPMIFEGNAAIAVGVWFIFLGLFILVFCFYLLVPLTVMIFMKG